MIRIAFLQLFLFLSFFLNAQINNIAISQKLSMHAAISDNLVDAGAILNNQAAGLAVEGLNYGVFAEKKYLINELNQLVLFVNKNFGKYGFTVIQDYNGFSESYCIQTSLGFSKYIANHSSVGLRFNYFLRHIKGFQKYNSLGSEISLLHQITQDLKTGLILINPHSIFNKKNNPLDHHSFFYKWGLCYDVTAHYCLFLDLMKSEFEKFGIVAGCEYYFNKKAEAMFSFSVQELSYRICFGFHLNKMKIKLESSFHPQLGYTPSIMLLSHFNEKPDPRN